MTPPRALYEARFIMGGLAIAWLFFLFVVPAVSVIIAIFFLYVLYFFRDPERVAPTDPSVVVSPADGKIVAIEEIEEVEFLKRKMKRISIFLSVFDVHVNRAPVAGEVTHSQPKPGKFLDARNPDSSTLNESRTWVILGEQGEVVVKQITGAIARRIVPWAKVSDRLEKGERFGMIRFGSRTELYLPLDSEAMVAIGDKVKGGETAIARLKQQNAKA
ncbi:MAG: phosphatidylserine decarboxylase family protein [Chthoniobacterales bacterium]